MYLRTQKARRGLETFSAAAASSCRRRSPESRGPRRSPQVAARRGASFGGQPPRLARPPRAWRGLGLPCGHRSHSRTGSRTSAARTATGRHPRQEVALRRDGAPQPRPAREGRGEAGQAPRRGPCTGRTGRHPEGRRSPAPAALRGQAASGAPPRRHPSSLLRPTRFRPGRSLRAPRPGACPGLWRGLLPLSVQPGRRLRPGARPVSGCLWRSGWGWPR